MRTAFSIERKEINDLVGCMKESKHVRSERARFERELTRGMDMEFFCVVAEASFDDIRYHRYRSKMLPHSVFSSLYAFQIRYKMGFTFAGSREGASYFVQNTLRLFLREKKNLQHILDIG